MNSSEFFLTREVMRCKSLRTFCCRVRCDYLLILSVVDNRHRETLQFSLSVNPYRRIKLLLQYIPVSVSPVWCWNIWLIKSILYQFPHRFLIRGNKRAFSCFPGNTWLVLICFFTLSFRVKPTFHLFLSLIAILARSNLVIVAEKRQKDWTTACCIPNSSHLIISLGFMLCKGSGGAQLLVSRILSGLMPMLLDWRLTAN